MFLLNYTALPNKYPKEIIYQSEYSKKSIEKRSCNDTSEVLDEQSFERS